MPRRPTVEVNKTIFRSFGPLMSEEDSSWEETGAFPSSSNPNNDSHSGIFTDDLPDSPFVPETSSFYSLEVVEEKTSREERGSSEHPSPRGSAILMNVSTTSSETPAADNTTTETVDKRRNLMSVRPSPSTGGGIRNYPFNIYQSLDKASDRFTKDDSSEQEHPLNKSKSRSLASYRTKDATVDRKGKDDSSMAPQITPMAVEEETSSVFTQEQSQAEAGSIQAPHSVVSARSRRQGKKYTVRRTLSTTQQVNAYPASMLKNMFISIEQERHKHKLTALNLQAVHNWVLFFPAILLSLVSGLVVFVFEADIKASSSTEVYASIFVGITSLTSVLWQAVSKQLDLGVRGALHDVTAGALKRLSEDILLTLSSTETIPAEYVALVAEKFAQALDSCPPPVPFSLECAFSSVSDRMVLMLKPPMGQAPRKHVQKLDFMHLYATMYDELTSEIIHHWTWPFLLPKPRTASDSALRNFKTIIMEGREINKKRTVLQLFCPCFRTDEVERSLFDVIPPASVTSSNEGRTNPSTEHRNSGRLHHEQHHRYNGRNAIPGEEV